MTQSYFYEIWRRHHHGTRWIRTAHSLTAKSDKEAASKLQRRFSSSGFTDMSMVAVKSGIDPNQAAKAMT